MLEKFIMDFEVLTHIQEMLPDCVVKGGMAVPFHLQDEKLQRLSVDVDIVTAKTREETIKAMKSVAKKLDGKVQIGEPHIPRKNNNKKLPLLTYYCKYTSSIDDNPEIKIEIFYGNSMNVGFKKIDSEIEILGFSIDFPLSVYDRGSLIGDKLTTLPLTDIGISRDRRHDVPKQIYDIATLLKSIPNEFPMNIIIDTFEKISRDEISYFKKDKPVFEDILHDLANFSDALLITENQIKLNSSYQGQFEKFTTEMLGNIRYKGYTHVTDILLIKTIIKLILKKFEGTELNLITQKAKQVLTKLDSFSKMESEEKILACKKLVQKYGKKSNTGKVMKNLQLDQAYLYDQLIEIEEI